MTTELWRRCGHCLAGHIVQVPRAISKPHLYLSSCPILRPLVTSSAKMSVLYRHERDLQAYSRRISLRAPPLPNPRPVLTIPPGRAAGWHQRLGTCRTVPAPKCIPFRKGLPQPLWELRLNADYGTLPGIPLLEALQGVGIIGADVPPSAAGMMMRLNIYWPTTGHVDYEEWFESDDIGSVSLGDVAYVVADLYRDLFERVGPWIRGVSPDWQIRPPQGASGICFGQLRLTRLYSYDYTRVYPEIVVVT
ncbi:hypothetical protein F5148DRAFT_1370368 [Russula earlei]|uniref:Uncharacterized protein n=1 Tax=Russula earlei TaxID=71964 RepID=A0ACC0TXD4_9AGAM|nr:hypothetical protein F5148DRAFT_1370368 [Russula earlei]